MTSPHGDRKYTKGDVLWRLRDHLQLRAVLVPLTGGYHRKDEIPERVLKIRRRWWGALNRLRKQGWDVLVDAEGGARPRLKSARDCPMTFVMVHGKPRPCNLRFACPFCWARQAADLWDRVDSAFTRVAVASTRGGSKVAQARGYKLVTRKLSTSISPGWLKDAAGAKLDLVLRCFYLGRLTGRPPYSAPTPEFARRSEIQAGMKAVAQPGRQCGCFENITVDLAKDRQTWRATIHQVWLVPAGRDLPVLVPLEGFDFAERVVVDPWRKDVMKAMARACRYPRAMLLSYRDGAPAHHLIMARAGLRLPAAYGAFRGSSGDDS